MTETALPLIIRVSSLPVEPDCPRRWAAEHPVLRKEILAAGYELREPIYGIAPKIGTAVHFGGEVGLSEKLTFGSLPPFDLVENAAIESLRKESADGVAYDAQYALSPREAELQVRRMSKAYHDHVAPRITPVFVEQRFGADVPGTRQPLYLSGQPDIVALENNAVDDTKSGVRPMPYGKQVGGYTMIVRSNGHPADEANIDFVPRATLRKDQPRPVRYTLPLALCEQEAMETIHNIDRNVTRWREGDHLIGPGDPRAFPANNRSNLCKERFCTAHSCSPERSFCNAWRTKE
jgi:hypothetical protein